MGSLAAIIAILAVSTQFPQSTVCEHSALQSAK